MKDMHLYLCKRKDLCQYDYDMNLIHIKISNAYEEG